MSDIQTKLKHFILFLGDVIILYFSLWLALLVRYGWDEMSERWAQHFLPFTIIFIIWFLIFYISGIYNLRIAKNNVFFYATLLQSIAWCAGTALAFFYLIKPGIAPKTNLLIELGFFLILFIAWRQIFNWIAKANKLQNNLLIVGLNEESFNLAKEINSKPQFGFRVAGIVCEREIPDCYSEQKEVEILTPPKSFLGLAKIKNIKGIITAFDPRKNPELIDKIYECLPLKISFSSLATFSEQFAGKIPVNSIGQVWFLENLKEQEKVIYEFGKRIFDIFISLILLIISIPFLPFIFSAIKIDSKGSCFFMQQRTGRNGKKFMAVKLRSMYVNSESNGPQWAQKNDPRVTKVGKFMRKTRIDEIPQLINIFRGEMSFIGPRPERPEFIAKLEKKIPFYNERLLIKPGLTGWAQINFPYGATEEDALQKLQYDLYYIKNRSLLLDLSILLKTIKTVLSGGGQ